LKASFLHIADVHLGNEQYGRKERADDFAQAFYHAIEYAIRQRVDFVVVAGDLFERATIDPVTFDQAMFGLEDLRKARIPVIDIAGNHDRARYGQGRAWVESLGLHGFLHYLDAATPQGIALTPWSDDDGTGSYLDLKGIRFVGMRFLGATTAHAVEELGKLLATVNSGERPYTICLLHGGLDGIVPNYRAELTLEQLSPLRGLVDYVALGHIHQHYVRDGWVYNPGSLETWNAGEVGWERGFLHVQVDTSAEPKHSVKLVQPPRRPFLRHRLDVQPCTAPEELLELVQRSAHEWARDVRGEAPVVHLTLSGRLRFDRRDLDMGILESALVEILKPLVVQLRDQTDETAFQPRAGGEDGNLDRAALELEVLQQLFGNDDRRVHQASGWARLAQSLKLGVVSKESPEDLASLVRREAPALFTDRAPRCE
jgi:DNA repair protein SbcD/Mre11